MMDDTPFISLNLKDVQNSGISDDQLKDIVCFTKSEFNPENIGAEAKKKLISASVVSFLEKSLKTPSDEFVKFILSSIGAFKVITKKIIDDSKPLITSATSTFIDKEILTRVGLSKKESTLISSKVDTQDKAVKTANSGVITTENELNTYNYVIQRLAFLIDSEELYSNLKHVMYQDYKKTFIVYYRSKIYGRLFSMEELEDGKMRFFFQAIEKEIITNDLKDIDEALLSSYKLRVNHKEVKKEENTQQPEV